MQNEDQAVDKTPEPINADGTPNVKFTAYGFDEKGFFRLCVHEARGICEILGLLEQMKDVVKARFIAKREAARQSKLVKPSGFFNGFKRR